MPHSVKASTTDFDSVSDGSNPSAAANPIQQDEIDTYRAHRHGIIQLSTGGFALFNPKGEVLAVCPFVDLESLIPTGPDYYEHCVDSFGCRERLDMDKGRQLLSSLGIETKHQHVEIKRRI